MKKKVRFTIRTKLSILSIVTIAITGVTLGIFLSNSFSQSAYNTATANLEGQASSATKSLENNIASTETSIKLLVNQIGYNDQFANNIEKMASEDAEIEKKASDEVKKSLTGAKGIGDGSSIIGAMDYLVVSDQNIENAMMYSPYVTSPILSRLLPVNSSKISFTNELYEKLNEHSGKSLWFFVGDDELYVWKALVNYGVEDTYDMKVVGYIEYTLNRESFLSPLTETKYENEGMVLLDENKNTVLSLSCGSEAIDNELLNSVPSLINGTSRKKTYTVSVNSISTKGWTFYSYINHDMIEKTNRQNTLLTTVVVSGAVIIGVVASILLSNGTIRRVKNLSSAATSISGGKYSSRVDVKANDEITDVGVSFNSMAGQIQDVLNELVLQQDSISENFAIILSNKSGESGNHVKRVSEYSAILAEELGFSESEVHDIRIASMLHDVGKIMIDESILHKPGRFTEEEYKIMQQHVVYGGQLLKGVPGNIMQLGAIIAEHHHERYDGKGYCKGLKGEEIPKEAQITSVADVFDALVSRRCYKDAWTIEQAYDEMVAQSGTQFGPDVIEAFKRRFEDFKHIAEIYKE